MDADDGRAETEHERLDRNLAELTGELRVVVTGVQVLFAFLLVVPFDSGFADLRDYERKLYFATLLLAALAAIFTIAPSAQHRLLFRHDAKAYLVARATNLAVAGLVCLALSMCCALALVASYLFGALAGAITGAAIAVPFAALWFAMPLRRAGRRGRRTGPSAPVASARR
ncbi:MAG TPA: DUF6328 family protein [Solirubrobacteraceae bacterium]|jgi:hypothetical protein|nr:DUF6328 family protein [Solirubrobacteraceae bacterium]